MTKPKVSVVIPAYNAVDSLEECLQSLKRQTYTNFDVYVIDDGSIDETANLCKSSIAGFNNFHYIYQANRGVSSARNRGLSVADGEYILFVDADDTVNKDYIESLIKIAVKDKTDMVLCSYLVEGDDKRSSDIDSFRKLCNEQINATVSPNIIANHILSKQPGYSFYGVVWRTLFSLELLKNNKIKFSDNVHIAEDFQFILDCLIHSTTQISIVPRQLYHYRISSKSVTTKYISSFCTDTIKVDSWLRLTLLKHFPDLDANLNQCLANSYLGCVQNLCRKGTPYSFIERIRHAYGIKFKYNYMRYIYKSILLKNSKKTLCAYILFIIQLDWFYILLFSFKENTLA